MSCCSCKYYHPTEIHARMGVCRLLNKTTFSDHSCEHYEKLDIFEALEEHGRVYCMDCRVWVYPEDAEYHKDHHLCLYPIQDEFVHEEIHAAD